MSGEVSSRHRLGDDFQNPSRPSVSYSWRSNAFDPTKSPKTIDFTIKEGDGKGNLHLGIYELGENTRNLCFAPPGKERPTEFTSKPGSQHILVAFERVISK